MFGGDDAFGAASVSRAIVDGPFSLDGLRLVADGWSIDCLCSYTSRSDSQGESGKAIWCYLRCW